MTGRRSDGAGSVATPRVGVPAKSGDSVTLPSDATVVFVVSISDGAAGVQAASSTANMPNIQIRVGLIEPSYTETAYVEGSLLTVKWIIGSFLMNGLADSP